MNAPAVLKAVYATWRPVPTRKVLQLVFEVPIEQTEIAMKTLGIPDVGESLWCAIARLQETQTQAEPSAAAITKDPPGGSKKRFSELPRSQQAALKLQDPAFCKWLTNNTLYHEIDADMVLKNRLGITSKKDLDALPERGDAFLRLVTSFETETRYGIK